MTITRQLSRAVAVLVFLLAAPGIVPAADQDAAKGKAERMSIKVSPFTKRPPVTEENIQAGRRLYENTCVFCHGTKGDGKGPVALFLSRDTGPQPRDFTSGVYKFRSTISGDLPMDQDLFDVITGGVRGFMPPFSGLGAEDRWRLVYYIESLYPGFKDSQPEVLEIVGEPIPVSGGSIQRGYEVYQQFKCWECHGGGGKGNGEKAADLKDDWGFLLPPQNLTMPSSFKNGNRPGDLYRTIMTGLDGGAMPSYGDFFEGREQDVWHLINYIHSLSNERR